MNQILKINARKHREKLEAKCGKGLDHIIEIIVPGTVDVSTQFDTTKYVKETARKMSEMFGGASVRNVDGYWISDTEGLVEEHNRVVYSNCDENSLDKYIDDVLAICSDLKTELKQECVALSVDGEMYFV